MCEAFKNKDIDDIKINDKYFLKCEINRKNAKNRAETTPNPLLSLLTEGCIEVGLDRALGAKYNTETVETMALVNTANAISAIDTLVFREGKYTVEESSPLR